MKLRSKTHGQVRTFSANATSLKLVDIQTQESSKHNFTLLNRSRHAKRNLLGLHCTQSSSKKYFVEEGNVKLEFVSTCVSLKLQLLAGTAFRYIKNGCSTEEEACIY